MLRLSGWVVVLGLHLALLFGLTGSAPSGPHDLHVAYGDLSLSETAAVLRIRLFSDDLARVLDRRELQPGSGFASADSVFLEYFRDRFELRTNGIPLAPRLLGGGTDRLGSETVSWYMLRFDAAEPIISVRIVNRVLFEQFDDQRNLLNVVYVPDETRRVFYFVAGEEEVGFEVGG